MAARNLTTDWAWISKEPRHGFDYSVLASSGDIDFGGFVGRYTAGVPSSATPPGSPGSPPWLTFGPFQGAAQTFISISILDQSERLDEAGRQIWPTRFFLLPYTDAAAADASYQGLWNTVREVQLPAADRKPLSLYVRPQSLTELADTVARYGLERMTAIASLLLEGRLALSESRLTHDERIAILDAVLALLPYGYRSVISASTGVNNTSAHFIDLVFADFPNEANRQALVSLAESTPIPTPRTGPAQDYLRLLRESIQWGGIQPAISLLWRANKPLRAKSADYALALMKGIAPTPVMLHARRRDAADAAQIAATADAHEPMLFGASYPGVLPQGVRQRLYVHLFREGIRNQLEARLAELAGRLAQQRRRSEGPANTIISPGTKLQIQPLITDVRSYPALRTITWHDEFSETPFEIESVSKSAVGHRRTGSVVVSTDGSLIAQLPISVAISAPSGEPLPPLKTVTAGMLRHVFGSYAREDAEIVTRFRAAYKALGIFLFVDNLDMPSGVAWKRYLEQQIEQSDAFQLFWSYASAASPAVESEWRHALTVADGRPPETEFIRPVFWTKPCPNPPEPLSDINFDYFDPQNFGLNPQGRLSVAIGRLLKAFSSFFGR